jgi:phosphatidate phosphatase PAH1
VQLTADHSVATGSVHRLQIEARLFLWPHDAALIVAEVDGILTFSEQALWQ